MAVWGGVWDGVWGGVWDGVTREVTPTATITHVKDGTFTLTFRGTDGVVIYCDPGNGDPVEEKTLLGAGTDVPFSYLNDGTERDVKITGALTGVTYLAANSMSITSGLSMVSLFVSLEYLYIASNQITSSLSGLSSLTSLIHFHAYLNQITGGLSEVSSLSSLTYLHLHTNKLTYTTIPWFTATTGIFYFTSTVVTAAEVDQWLIDLAAANWSNCIVYLNGTNPARTSASDGAVGALIFAGVTLHLN